MRLVTYQPGPGSTNANSAVLLLTSRSQKSAVEGCAALGETLWSPELKTASIQPNLDYLAFEGCAEDQQYWIASTQSSARTIDGKGHISNVKDSSANLPVLCTQSAPFSNSTFQDPSARWQVSVHSNNEYLTGYVISIFYEWGMTAACRFSPAEHISRLP